MKRRVLTLLMLFVMEAALISLGLWQLQRREWKAKVIARIERNRDAPPIEIVDPTQITAASEFRRARLSCAMLVGQALSEDTFTATGDPAKRSYTPCLLSSGRMIVVREALGGQAENAQATCNPPPTPSLPLKGGGGALVTKAPSPLEGEGGFERREKPGEGWNLKCASGRIRFWQVPTFAEKIGGIRHIMPADFPVKVAPFYLDADAAVPSPPNNHLAYAIQWFSFAVILAVIFVLRSRKQRRM